jgi:hypothetical protein
MNFYTLRSRLLSSGTEFFASPTGGCKQQKEPEMEKKHQKDGEENVFSPLIS